MSDRNVLFGYLQRDPRGQKTLLIKDLSPEMGNDSLMANLMTVCKIDVDEVYIMTESQGSALARLSENILDVQKLQERVWARGFNGNYPTLTLLGQSTEDNCLAQCVRSSERPVTAEPLPSSDIRLSSGLLSTAEQSLSSRAEASVRPVTTEPVAFSEIRSTGLLSITEQSPSSRIETSDRTVSGDPLPFLEKEIQSSGPLFTTEQSPSLRPETSDRPFITEFLCGYPQSLDVDLIKDDSEHPESESPCKDLPVARVSPFMAKSEETDTESFSSDDEFQDLFGEKLYDPVSFDDMPADLCSRKETLQKTTIQNLEVTSTQSFQIGKVRLEIKKGDIAKQEAEVLVNVVSPAGKLVGSVSKAFIANGGCSFPVLYDSAKDRDNLKRLVCTKSSGQLKCSEIFHVRLERGRPEAIVEVVEKILLKCEAKEYSILAMPPLGIGQMYGYSSDIVARAMLTYLSQYGEKTDRNMLIGIVIFDDETYRVFCDVFASLQSISLSVFPHH